MCSSSSSSSGVRATLIILGCLLLCRSFSNAQLNPSFYNKTCPSVFNVTRNVLVDALRNDPRIAASLIRLHFHDCFVRGCDGSILLDNSTSFRTEKDAAPNANSARGFDVVDQMKAAVERACPRTVSCADVLTIAARESVVLSGGPSWTIPLGRRDSREAFFNLANTALPSPFFTLDQLKSSFSAVGLNLTSDLVALSGGHTFGRVQCQFIVPRLYNFSGTGQPDPTLNTTYLTQLRQLCPQNGNLSVLVNFDPVTPNTFDNQYYSNLRVRKGAIQSDQELFSTPGADTIALVELYSRNTTAFYEAFVRSMIRMGNITPLTGNQGEIRLNCRVVNPQLRGVESKDGFVSSF